MVVKSNTLEKQIEEVENFVAVQVAQAPAYAAIYQALTDLKRSLTLGKLVFQIVGQNSEQVQNLEKLLAHSPSLREGYDIRTTVLPDFAEPELTSAVLALQNGNAPTYYELSSAQTYKIGRNPHTAQVLLADALNLVSGCHAELQFLPNAGWQIRDLESRNGTYLNGKCIKAWETLEAGNQICLGSATDDVGSGILSFEYFIPVVHAGNVVNLFDCDVIGLIVDLNQPISKETQRFIQQAIQATVSKVFVVAVPSMSTNPEVAKNHLSDLEEWVNVQPYSDSVEITHLLLQPIARNLKATVLLPHAQPEFESFCQSLITLAQGKIETIIFQRSVAQLAEQIKAIEVILNHQQATLLRKIQQGETKLQEIGQSSLKDHIKKASDTVKKEVDQFFRQVKSEIGQSKSDLLSENRQNSLTHKIKQFVRKLKPIAVIKGSSCHIHFQTKNGSDDIHAVLNYLYQCDLKNWTIAEWTRICTLYNVNGLIGLLRSSYRTLNFMPDSNLSAALFQPPREINVDQILQITTVAADCKTHYKQMTFQGFIFKRLKSEVISLISLIAMVGVPILAFLGLEFNKAVFTLPILPLVGIMMYFSYRWEKAEKLEDAVEKLQEKLADHYQKIAKDIADRLAQHLMMAMESEERRLRDAVDVVGDQYMVHVGEFEKKQLQLKTQTEELKKVQQKSLEKDMAEFQKLKRDLSISTKP
ncbi:MAG: FHA domain-containing protein [Timaviella obliquedivisa GSE-PSE-MK23-08B]|jgi:pSer/pThr/pTyr-binding forkhead associated (FHA) protein|nr:FHA domain-containing protein [Timaviella obliquedivisa GSE-PSE-MK23-08B]